MAWVEIAHELGTSRRQIIRWVKLSLAAEGRFGRKPEHLGKVVCKFPPGPITPGTRCDCEINPIKPGSCLYCPICHSSGYDSWLPKVDDQKEAKKPIPSHWKFVLRTRARHRILLVA